LGLTATSFSLPLGELASNSTPLMVVALKCTMHVSSGFGTMPPNEKPHPSFPPQLIFVFFPAESTCVRASHCGLWAGACVSAQACGRPGRRARAERGATPSKRTASQQTLYCSPDAVVTTPSFLLFSSRYLSPARPQAVIGPSALCARMGLRSAGGRCGVRVRAWAGRAWEEGRRRTFRRGTTLHQLQRERQRERVH